MVNCVGKVKVLRELMLASDIMMLRGSRKREKRGGKHQLSIYLFLPIIPIFNVKSLLIL